jgi:hypothetical protein
MSGAKRRRVEESSRSRAVNDDLAQIEDEYESRPRATRPEWTADAAGRLPLVLSDGKLAAQPPRPLRILAAEPVEEEDASKEEELEDPEVIENTGDGPGPIGGVISSDRIKSFAALHTLPQAQLAARRAERRVTIAELSEMIISDPTHNVSDPVGKERKPTYGTPVRRQNSLLSLHQLCGDPDPAIRKLAMLSCTMVFKDVLPGYRIRLPSSAEADLRVKKEVKALRSFESALLTGYQRFLKLLEVTASRGEQSARRLREGTGTTPEDIQPDNGVGFDEDAHGQDLATNLLKEATHADRKKERLSASEFAAAKMAERRAKSNEKFAMTEYDADDRTKYQLGVASLKCMCELLAALPHFNFRANIVAFVAPRMSAADDEVAAACYHAIETLFTTDSTGDASLEVTRVLSKMLKDAPSKPGTYSKIKPRALESLLKLKLQHSGRGGRETSLRDAKAKAKAKKGRSDDPYDENDVLAGLKEADAEALEERKANSTATLKTLIALYFRVLRAPSAAHLLPPVLKGLAKFAHLIDVSVVTDLLASLKALLVASAGIESTLADLPATDDEGNAPPHKPRVKLSTESALNCALTALEIMAGPGELLNADETEFAGFLYGVLLRLQNPVAWQYIPLASRAVGALLLTRREYSVDRVAAFARRCLFVALSVPASSSLALMALVRQLSNKYPVVAGIFRTSFDGSVGAAALHGGLEGSSKATTSSSLGSIYDPDRTHALRSTAWELGLMHSHYHPYVRSFAVATASNAPLAPSDMPDSVFRAYNEASGAFRPAVVPPKPHPFAKFEGTDTASAGSKRKRQQYLRDTPLSSWLARLASAEEPGLAIPPSGMTFVEHFMDRLETRANKSDAIMTGIIDLHGIYK